MSFEGSQPKGSPLSAWMLFPVLMALACGVRNIPRPEAGGDEDEMDAEVRTQSTKLDSATERRGMTSDGPGIDAPRTSDGAGAATEAGADAEPDGPIACVPGCGASEICKQGQCETVCPPSQTLCRLGCANLATDPSNCGTCEKTCAANQFCSQGACVTNCGQGETKCGQSCVSLTSDRANCGLCGKTCAGAEQCTTGACTCASPNKVCDGTCQNLTNNRDHCGSCDIRCNGDLICRGTTCGCPTSKRLCPNKPNTCVNSLNDCCPSGQAWCGDRCVNTKTDNENCGGCGKLCLGAQKCSNGQCGCPANQPHACAGNICLPPGQCCANETKCSNDSCIPNTACCPGMRRCGDGHCIAADACCADEKACGNKCLSAGANICCPTDTNPCGVDTKKCNEQNQCVCVFACPNGGKCAKDASGCCEAGATLCGDVCCPSTKVCTAGVCQDIVVSPDAGNGDTL